MASSGGDANKVVTDEVSLIKRELGGILRRNENVNKHVFDWIQKNLNISSSKDRLRLFIRALVTVVVQSTIRGEAKNYSINHDLLVQRTAILKRYIDNDDRLKLEALYAVQALNQGLENPPRLLGLIFNVLFDEDIISEETFYAWKDSTDPDETLGKGVALKSVTSFFDWLKEAEDGAIGTSVNTGQPIFSGRHLSMEPKEVMQSVSQTIKLKTAGENAWNPNGIMLLDKEEAKTVKLLKKMKALLNKLTPNNFDTLKRLAINYPIDTEERLKGIIDLVFEKAINETMFSKTYAKLCRDLSQMKVPAESGNGVVQFRTLLINRCQKEFEKEKSNELDEKIEREKIAQLPEGERASALEDLENKLIKNKKRMLGNIRFVGELFMLQMLIEQIMHDCVFKLLCSNDEDSLECVVHLLMTIGKTLDHERAKNRINQYFKKLMSIINQKTVSARVRFMLQDVVELRKRNWVPKLANDNLEAIKQERGLMAAKFRGRGPPGFGGKHSSSSREQDQGNRERGSAIRRAPALSPEDFKKKSIAIFKEYLNIRDIHEAIMCVSEMNCPSQMNVFVQSAMYYALEKTARERNSIGLLLHSLLKAGHLTNEKFVEGVKEILVQAEDMALGIPLIWKYLGEIIGSVFRDNWLSLTMLGEMMDPVMETGKAGDLMAEILLTAIKINRNSVSQCASDNPKTIKQIRKDNKREEQKMSHNKQKQLQRVGTPWNEGWNTVSSKAVRVSVDPHKFMVANPKSIDGDIQLGPARTTFGWGKRNSNIHGSGWGRSSSRAQPSQDANRFMMLSEYEPGRGSKKAEFRGRGPPGFDGKHSSSSRERDSACRQRESAIAEAQKFAGGKRSHFIKKDYEPDFRRGPPEPIQAAPPKLSPQVYEKKSIATIEEYLRNRDTKEAIMCVSEMNCPSQMNVFVQSAMYYALEKTAQGRDLIGLLLHSLLKAGHLTNEKFVEGVKEVLMQAEDMALDISGIWKYLGEIIGSVYRDNSLSLSVLREMMDPVREARKAGDLMAEILLTAVKINGPNVVAEMWKSAGFTWEMFLPVDKDVQEFVNNKKLEFTLTLSSGEGDTSDNVVTDEEWVSLIKQELGGIMRRNENVINDVFDWIQKNLNISSSKDRLRLFIRTLVTVVVQSTIQVEADKCRVNHDLLVQRTAILKCYIDNDDRLELEALYAVQALNKDLENPPRLLGLIFNVLYDEDIIPEETFYAWKDSTDPDETLGKGVALKSVTSFFDWLKEAEDEAIAGK